LLISCPGCGKRVSDRAPKCPFCSGALAAAVMVAPPAPSQQALNAPSPAAVPAPPPPPVLIPPMSPGVYQRGDAIGDQYRVDRVLGEGGFGIVYLVHARRGGGRRALKTIRDVWLRDDATRALFRKEAELWIGLGHHPYLVRADFVDEEHGRLFLVMEYVPPDSRGLSGLEDRLERDPPDLDQTLRFAVQFCHGMEYAYSRGIRCHRDIKPANILVGGDGAIRITDFGIAGVVAAGAEAPPLARVEGMGGTMAGSVFGTPTHMSPEQFVDASSCDERSDIYSFGVVLYQMVAGGRLPFRPQVAPGPGAPRRLFEEMRRLQTEVPPAPLDSPLMPVIARCLQKDRALRYPGFAVLRADLARLLLDRTGETVLVPARGTTAAEELCQRGLSLASLGRHAEALAAYDEALRQSPDEPVLHSNRGNALSHLDRLDEALAAFARAVALRPRYDTALANRALALARAGRFLEALGDCDQALAWNARSTVAWQARGVVLSNLGRRVEAIAAYDAALEVDARDPVAWSNKAGNLLELGRYQEAIAAYDRALAIDPGAAAGWAGKATALAQTGHHQEALPCYDEAQRLEPWDPRAFYNKGNSLVQLQRYEESLGCFEQATLLSPESAVFWYNRAVSELVLEQPQRAAISLRQYLGRAPETDDLVESAHGLLHGIESGALTGLARGSGPPQPGELRPASLSQIAPQVEAQPAAVPPPPAATPAPPTSPMPQTTPAPAPSQKRLTLGPTVGDLNNEGDRHFRAGRFAEALAAFERALERDPFGAVALGNRSNALFKLGRVDEAIAGHEQALACNPFFLASWASKAAIEQMSGRRAAALASYREVIAGARPDQGAALAEAQARSRQLEQAGVVASPRSALSWLGEGARHGAAGQWPEAVDALTQALAQSPHLTEAWLMKAEALRHLEMRESAAAVLQEALRQRPLDPQLWHARGVELKNAGAHEDALSCYDRALSMEPRYAAAWSDRGLALGALKRFEEGIESLERAIALRPDSAPPWINKALAEEEAHRPADAVHSYHMFLERATPEQRLQSEMAKDRLALLEPLIGETRSAHAPKGPLAAGPPQASTSPPVRSAPPAEALKKGLFCQNQGQHERAVEWFEVCLAGDPTNLVALAGKGDSLRQLTRYALALPCFESALARNPAHAPTWVKKGACLESLDRLDEALQAFEEAARHDSKNPVPWTNRGRVLARMNRLDDALRALASALALDPRSPLPRFYMADVFERLGRGADAARAYQQFLATALPTVLAEEVQRARARLTALRGGAP